MSATPAQTHVTVRVRTPWGTPSHPGLLRHVKIIPVTVTGRQVENPGPPHRETLVSTGSDPTTPPPPPAPVPAPPKAPRLGFRPEGHAAQLRPVPHTWVAWDDGMPLRPPGLHPRPHLAERPRGALGAAAAEAVPQVLTEATVAGVAGTRAQLQLAVPAAEAPWAHTLVAGRQVLGQGEQSRGR